MLIFCAASRTSFAQFIDHPTSDKNRFIVTDFNNCTVGLKDSLSHWVVQPIYDEIQYGYYGTYVVSMGGKYGVIDGNGRVLIPIIYSEVTRDMHYLDFDFAHYPPNSYEYIVKQNKKYGVVDTSGKIIVPLLYKDILMNEDSSILAWEKGKNYCFYSFTGEAHPLLSHPHDAPKYLGDHLYKTTARLPRIKKSRSSFRFYCSYRCGVVNDQAKEILPPKFAMINYFDDRYSFIAANTEKQFGYFTPAGQVTIPMRPKINGTRWGYYFSESNFDVRLFETTGNMPLFSEKHKWGMVNYKGDTILPFDYGHLVSCQTPTDYNKYHASFIVEKDSLYGCFSPEAGWIIPLKYDWLHKVGYFYFPADSAEVQVFLAYKNGKCGIISSVGDTILPLIYDGYYQCTEYQYVFTKGDSLMCFAYTRGSYNQEKEVSTVYSPDNFRFNVHRIAGVTYYVIPNGFQNSWNRKRKLPASSPFASDSVSLSARIITYPVTNYVVLSDSARLYNLPSGAFFHASDSTLSFYAKTNPRTHETNFETMYSSFGTIDKRYMVTNKNTIIIDRKFVYHPEVDVWMLNTIKNSHGDVFFSSQFHNNYLLFDSTGKVLLNYNCRTLNDFNEQYVWMETRIKRKFRSKYYFYTYNIYSIADKKLLLDKYNYSKKGASIVNGYTVVTTATGVGLYNLSAQKFTIQPNYGSLLQLDKAGNYYAIKTCWGNIGIITKDGVWISDTTWTAVTSCNPSGNDSIRSFHGNYDYLVLYNQNSHLIFETATGTIHTDNTTEQLLVTSAFKPIHSLYYLDNDRSRDFSKRIVRDTSIHHPAALAPWQEKIIFDILYLPNDTFYYNYSNYDLNCDACLTKFPKHRLKYQWSQDEDARRSNYNLTFQNDSVLSVVRLNDWFYSNSSDVFSNTFLFADGPHQLSLDSILIGDWKTFVVNQVMSYIETHNEVKGNCHNPAWLPNLLNNRFVFSTDGLVLYPPGFSEGYKQLAITIPFEKLKPYLRKDIAIKLGIQ